MSSASTDSRDLHGLRISPAAFRLASLALCLAACALALSACDQSKTPTTVGQKVDAAIDKTHAVAADVGAEARTAMHDAGKRIDENAPRVQSGAHEAATNAKKVVDDVAITAQVSTGLARDPDLSALKIDVDTKDGAVILRGPAPSSSARERAGDIARGIAGVVSVDNQLVVKAG